MRAYNERLVLSLVRSHEALSKADIARASGLSAQTVSVIMRALEKDGLLIKGEPVRGKVGQPSVRCRSMPKGCFLRAEDRPPQRGYGADGFCRRRPRQAPAHLCLSDAAEILAFVKESIAALEASLTPLQLRGWQALRCDAFRTLELGRQCGGTTGRMDAWRDFRPAR